MRDLMLAAVAATSILIAQRIETQAPDPRKVTLVETAKDHLTVIEVGDPVTMVAVGNPGAFTVERRENRVFIKPVEDEARTNLFIWTSAGRYAYELAPAQRLDQMHFAIDHERTVTASTPAVQPATPLPPEMLTQSKPILMHGERHTEGRVEVTLREVYREGNRLYLRYALVNRSGSGYEASPPAAWQLGGVRAPQSLVAMGERQLGERLSRALKVETTRQIEILAAEQTRHVAAGGTGLGWVAIDAPKSTPDEMTVVRLQFAADPKGPVDALLVLSPLQEVSHARTDAGDR